MTKPSGLGILLYSGNSGASPTAVHGIAGSGPAGWYGDVIVQTPGLTGTYSDLTTGFTGAYSPSGTVMGTPNVSGDTGPKSSAQIQFEERRLRLISAILNMKGAAPNWSGIPSVVREDSANSAAQFLRCLPGDAILPRIAPDGEGDVMLVWEGPRGNCIVTVEKRSLHLVSEPGKVNVHQVGPQQFLGFSIPPSILTSIPRS
jgi:hypothetical protein